MSCDDVQRVLPGSSLELLIGANGNTQTILRTVGSTTNLAVTDTLNIMSCTEPRFFWISWHNQTLRLGLGYVYSISILIDYTLPAAMTVGGLGLATTSNDGEWRVQESVGERVIVRTPSVFNDFDRIWRTVTQQTFIVFSVRTCSDCHVALSPMLGVDPAETYYDLVIAGYSNQISLLHRITDIHRVVVSNEFATPNLLNCTSHVDLWVRWVDGQLTFGRGLLPGYDEQFNHDLTTTGNFPIKAVGFSTGFGNDGDFIIDEDSSDYFMFYTAIGDGVRWLELYPDVTWIPIRIRACDQVWVYLCNGQSMNSCYKIAVGSEQNQKSSITLGSSTVSQADTPDILHCLNSRNFWLRWAANGRLDIGHGTIPGSTNSTFLFYQDTSPIRPISFVGFESTVGEDRDIFARFQVNKNAIASTTFFANDIFSFEQMWETVERKRHVVFAITACSDAHVVLSNRLRWFSDVYELIIGGWQNTRSTVSIRNAKEFVAADTPNFLHCTEQRWFWFTWQYGAIEVGQGQIVGVDRFLDFQPMQMYPVNAIGYSSGWGYNGTWYIPISSGKSSILT